MPDTFVHTIIESVLTVVLGVVAYFMRGYVSLGQQLSKHGEKIDGNTRDLASVASDLKAHMLEDDRRFERSEDSADRREANLRGEIASLRGSMGR